MKPVNILFTSVGRRIELVEAFRSAGERLGIDICIHGTDIRDDAPGLFYCNKRHITPRISEDSYIPELIRICRDNDIKLLIPTIDTDLLILAHNKKAFLDAGTTVLVSEEDKISICRDKRKTSAFFKDCGLKSPEPVDDYLKYDGGFPCFIKPKDGSSSINAFKIEDAGELETFSKIVPDYIIQPFIKGKEYTVDVLCGFTGKPVYITARERVQVRSGEVIKTRIVHDDKIEKETEAIIQHFEPAGPVTVQLIREETTGDDYFIEINPRFGGGSPLSMKAGADSALALLDILVNGSKTFMPGAAVDGAEYSRFDNCVCTDPGDIGEWDIKAVVFDLDDTLYNEKDYIKSGFRAVSREFPDPQNVYDSLISYQEKGLMAIDELCSEQGLSKDRKAELVELYRNHMPDIELNKDAEGVISALRAAGIKTGIITDGRPEGQRNKLEALGLRDFVDEIIITDELGGVQFRKPNDIAFRIMQKRFNIKFENIIYVGDNMSKDFMAPERLGMKSCLYLNKDGLYTSPGEAMLTIDTLKEITEFIR